MRNSDEEDDEDEDESQLRAAAKSAAGADDVFECRQQSSRRKQQQKKKSGVNNAPATPAQKYRGKRRASSPASGGRLVYTAARNSALFTTAPHDVLGCPALGRTPRGRQWGI